MPQDVAYTETVSSNKTEALFVGLALLFLLLSAWRLMGAGFDFLGAVFLFFFGLFLFYSLNYRMLVIRMTPDLLELRFGIFRWRVPLDRIEACHLDDVSMWRIGGAGIHFSPIRRRYRAMLNFLEHPRVVLGLQRKMGLVRDIAFSTRRPDEVMQFIQRATAEKIDASPHGY
jgi:hypothetical protein